MRQSSYPVEAEERVGTKAGAIIFKKKKYVPQRRNLRVYTKTIGEDAVRARAVPMESPKCKSLPSEAIQASRNTMQKGLLLGNKHLGTFPPTP